MGLRVEWKKEGKDLTYRINRRHKKLKNKVIMNWKHEQRKRVRGQILLKFLFKNSDKIVLCDLERFQ